MENDSPIVYVVDDEVAVSTALARSLGKRGYQVATFESGEVFLEQLQPHRTACLVLDMRMGGMSGTELQEYLVSRKIILPIIFVSGHGDIPMSVRAIKSGAIDFLEKPYPVDVLAKRIEEALQKCVQLTLEFDKQHEVMSRYESLTPRECDVMTLLVAGAANASNKVIARELDISHRTVDDHRARVMAKMQARSLPELVEMAKACGVHRDEIVLE